MAPFISIIVPVFKAECFINRCVDSILAQTFTDFELLLVDDGSPDKSGEICDQYAARDSRVRVFHKENGGVSSARNHGIKNATGKWVTFCDADDYLDSDCFESLSSHTLNVEMVAGGFKSNKGASSNVVFSEELHYEIKDFISEIYNPLLLGSACNKFFINQIIKDNQLLFPANLTHREDLIFVLSYLTHCKKVSTIKESGYIYWENPNSATHKDPSFDVIYASCQEITHISKQFGDELYNQLNLNLLYLDLDVLRRAFYKDVDKSRRLETLRFLKNKIEKNPRISIRCGTTRKNKILLFFLYLPLPLCFFLCRVALSRE